jgi:hypothetical protein
VFGHDGNLADGRRRVTAKAGSGAALCLFWSAALTAALVFDLSAKKAAVRRRAPKKGKAGVAC